MNHPSTVREALIVEAVGDVAQLLQQVEALSRALTEANQALLQTSQSLQGDATALKRQIVEIAEQAKSQTVKHIVARADEASRRAVELQSRAMADAARVAFGAELGATIERLQATLQPLLRAREPRWEHWLTHLAAAAASAAATWVAVLVWPK
jgi:DNA repair exonuclease SbcCD ATPase subunit